MGVTPLYRLLRHTEHFEWMDAATAGLDGIKAILATNPVLAAPNIGEPMLTITRRRWGSVTPQNFDLVLIN